MGGDGDVAFNTLIESSCPWLKGADSRGGSIVLKPKMKRKIPFISHNKGEIEIEDW